MPSERTATISVTQFLRPHGQKQQIKAPVTPELEALAQKVIAAGYRFEAEVLTTGEVSLDCCNADNQIAWGICENGPKVPETIDLVIKDAARNLGII